MYIYNSISVLNYVYREKKTIINHVQGSKWGRACFENHLVFRTFHQTIFSKWKFCPPTLSQGRYKYIYTSVFIK